MPSRRARAAFEPLPPDLDIIKLVEETPNFEFVDRISCDMIDKHGIDKFDKLVSSQVIKRGKPLIVDGYQARLDPWTFSPGWLKDNYGEKHEIARDLTTKTDLPLSIGHYLKNMGKLTNQYFEGKDNYRDMSRQRIYLKDIDCPPVWLEKLKEQLPQNLMYLNESTGQVGGPGAVEEVIPGGSFRKGKGIAIAGDLMSSLPPPMRADNLMCYIGHEGTHTPAHREMCASVGHNIMVEASGSLGDGGVPEKPGSSIWFMTESNDRHLVSEYWLSILGHDIEVENHFAQIEAWKNAPFKTYVVEQRPGDFILIPPLAPHQVWNRGSRTMKVAWNRTTAETLEMALDEALPRARMVCRDEQYKNKAIVYYTLQKYAALMEHAAREQATAITPEYAYSIRTSAKVRQLGKNFVQLFQLFKAIMLSEMFSPTLPPERSVDYIPYDSNVTCAYCRCNIFNRFLTCPSCVNDLGRDEPEPYDVCMECYVMGRSCQCISRLKWVEQFKWRELTESYEKWRLLCLNVASTERKHPEPLKQEYAMMNKKTLAEICQEQLKRRPWVDISKPMEEEESSDQNDEIEMDESGRVKKLKSKKKRSAAWLKSHHACHVCCHRHEKWKMAECSCGRWWCYGALFRAFDLMPQSVMEDANWQCPHCKNICSVGACRKDSRHTPYQPKGTLLGHDTKKVADARSVESLVDFSVSNLTWLKETAEVPEENERLKQRQEEASQNKSLNDADDSQSEADHDPASVGASHMPDISQLTQYTADSYQLPAADEIMIDPLLRGDGTDSGHQLQMFAQAASQAVNGFDGYQPATQDGFVSPTDVLFVPPMPLDHAHVQERPPAALKYAEHRKRKKGDGTADATSSRKKKRSEDFTNRNGEKGATKQYRKEQERKTLEEAKRNGRYTQVYAALKGRQRVVKLRLPSDQLRMMQTRTSLQQTNTISVETDAPNPGIPVEVTLLESDLTPAKPVAPRATTTKAKKPDPVRVRVDLDEDFGTRSDRRKVNGVRLAQNRTNAVYDEVSVASDEDESVNASLTRPSRGDRRLARMPANERNTMPLELPNNWKDPGRRNPRNATVLAAERTAKASSKVTTAKVKADSRVKQEPRPERANYDKEGTDDFSEADSVDGVMPIKAVSMSKPPPAQQHFPTKPQVKAADTPNAPKKSIFDKIGPGRRNIRIVSSSAKAQS